MPTQPLSDEISPELWRELHDMCEALGDTKAESKERLDGLLALIHQDREANKQKMAMCTDDVTFLEEHKFANVIECDETLKRPSRAIYHNRQWEAERQGLDTLALLPRLTHKQKEK